ncbi:MAG: hypothetical protein UCO57_14570 [Gemmiger sp.]|uniref:hypothetical protein n=1 Tax=Gemmiger sp. TaxID=2049027 RepID=UPI002E798D64|nr:hypothetical protein [Gemmiger sp.]MEE0709988.1 hypothetical protein [Gemmiger sp.]
MKKWLATLLLGAALTLTALPVAAQGTDSTVTMNADGSHASVSLTLPQEAAWDVTALRLSFQVESSNGAKAQFDFDDGLPSSVQQYRYNEETGRLTVYIAGRDEFLKNGTVSLGEIQLDAAPGTVATVRVVEDSLELANAAYGKAETTSVAGTSVDLSTAEEETPVPTQTPAAPDENGQSSSGGGSSSSQSTAAQTPAPTPEVSTSPVGTSAPVQVVQGTTSTVSGSSKPSGGKATPKPSASPEPSSTPQASAAPAPSAAPEDVAETATPEQTVQEQTSGLNASLVIAIVLGVLAVAALVAVAVIWFRGR